MQFEKFIDVTELGSSIFVSFMQFEKFIDGGHQERNKRAGTENVANIVGLAKALEMAYDKLEEHTLKISQLRDYYENSVKESIPNIKIDYLETAIFLS